MGNYLDLRYNEVSFKAAHNSYQRDETLIDQLTWDKNEPFQAGCRGVELDISQSSNGKEWSVGHEPGYETNFRQLSQFLAELRAWRVSDPDHDVITLYLDLKKVNTTIDPSSLRMVPNEKFPDELDRYIRKFLEDNKITPVYTPGELKGKSKNLAEGAKLNGWPRLSKLSGKFIICLTGDSDAKTTYVEAVNRPRLCFVDTARHFGESPRSSKDPDRDVDRVFFNYKVGDDENSVDKSCTVFKKTGTQSNEIIRAHTMNEKPVWDAALRCGFNLLTTDAVRDHSWAKVGNDDPFVKLKSLS